MANRKNKEIKDKQDANASVSHSAKIATQAKIERLCKCDRILSNSEIEITEFGDATKFYHDQTTYNVDACNNDLEKEYSKIIRKLNLPEDTYSLTKIQTNLLSCLKYGFRSGLTHMNMQKFSPLTRGYQGPAIAVAAIATSYLIQPDCWNEPVIDQIIEDGDTYYSNSYKHIKTDDRRTLTLLDLKRDLEIRKTHRVIVKIDDPVYAGTFKSETPKELHIAKALDLFFKKYNAAVLTSAILNIAIWKSSKAFNIFDPQARLENCDISSSSEEGGAKLFIVQNLHGVLFIILEKSNVQNEPFVLYNINVTDIRELSSIPDESGICLEEPRRRPSGYRIQEKYRAVVQGSLHLHHSILPEEFRGKGHLIVAVAALVYSKLLKANKWTKTMIDLIFNQSNIYLTDLVRVLGKTLNDNFELKMNELLCDVIFGVYTVKIKVQENVFPGEGKKKKATIDMGIREFFQANTTGILEIKKTFYAIWKENEKYYFFDPFTCDSEGFRVDLNDLNEANRYEKVAACISMNSSIDQLIEIILENTQSKEKDPFIIHGLVVLYIKMGTTKDGSDEEIVYRAKKTNRRPRNPTPPPVQKDECLKVIDTLPRPRYETEITTEEKIQYPDIMDQAEMFLTVFDEKTYIAKDVTLSNEEKFISEYKMINSHRLILEGTINCLDEEFIEESRGRQGLIIALLTLAKAKQIKTSKWTSTTINQIILDSNLTYEQIVKWIREGSIGNPFHKNIDNHTVTESFTSKEIQNFAQRGLDHLDLSMLPKTIQFNDVNINLTCKMNITQGETNPLANLGEALEQYFENFDELIFENKSLFYGIWKENKKYFILNPYGSDKSGWRNLTGSAAFVVIDSIIELINFLYGLLEFNDYYFFLHFVQVTLQEYDDFYEDSQSFSSFTTTLNPFEKYAIKFLPITNIESSSSEKVQKNETIAEKEPEKNDISTTRLSEIVYANNEWFEDEEQHEKLSKLFEKVQEPEQSDPPATLNFALVTGIVKIEYNHENLNFEKILEVLYEKLKYKHPPPFVKPPKKNLCDILNTKLASKSINSLVSRFSIDSKLAIKEKSDLPSSIQQDAIITVTESTEKSKLITLPPQKYLFSLSLPSGLTPIRAIDEQYIRNKTTEKEEENDCRKKKLEKVVMIPKELPNVSTGFVLPLIIPLGPCIMTPKFISEPNNCPDKKKKKCSLSVKEQEDIILKKIVCSTENILLELLLPDFKEHLVQKQDEEQCSTIEEDTNNVKEDVISLELIREEYGFVSTDDKDIGIITANTSLTDRNTILKTHFKSCYFAAILCILAKINIDVQMFHSTVLDRFVAAANKIDSGVGKLRFKIIRWFRNFNILGVKYDVIVKQVRYTDPENHVPDAIETIMKSFLDQYQTGVLVFENVSYAFWYTNEEYYLFDPYSCDENGRMSSDGSACLMKICNYNAFIDRIIHNTGQSSTKPYRLYTVSIAHIEKQKKSKIKKKCIKSCKEERLELTEEANNDGIEDLESEASLIELSDWVKNETNIFLIDSTAPGFLPIKNFNASAIEVEVLENDITRPILAPLKSESMNTKEPNRWIPYDRKFYENSVLTEPIDLCIMAWSQIYDPFMWSVRTIQALYEASREYTLDSIFASEDSTIPQMWDNILTNFNIANYNFRVVFAPIHVGSLYVTQGWNLAMSLNKIFESSVYTGAILVCGNTHIGVMKKENKFYAWWLVNRTKNIRIIISEDERDYLKLIIKEINEPQETTFVMRIITISYAKMFGPNCSDLEGLHESMMPSTSIPEIHLKEKEILDSNSIFRRTDKCKTPVFLHGTVALDERDTVMEPRVKRCYFVALLAVIMKRDIIQNPLPEMIDKIMELADRTYKLFEKPKYHTDHILKDFTLMDRVFDLRDCSSEVVILQDGKQSIDENFLPAVKKQLKIFFRKYTSGIIHFSNCCYGFWYSNIKNCYYYLDPYKCNSEGKRVSTGGWCCLYIFKSICDMAKQMCINHYEKTTGFFIHRIHVEAVNPSPYDKFQEDPIWLYLDYHWSYRHTEQQFSQKYQRNTKEQHFVEDIKKPIWKNYLIEVPNMIYSLWGTIGSFDIKFDIRAGKNQTAIAIAAFALQNLCHPSEWNSVVLDSIVVCGDHFYKESKKVRTRYLNKFNLSECFKVSPFLWSVEFTSDLCGVLYGSKNQSNLADRIVESLNISSTILLQCKKKILAIIKTSDAFYAVDSSWTGPPLFSKNHGAIYVIRCKTTNTLIYVLIKMLNTNEKLEFSITPVKVAFKQETCQLSDVKPKVNRKKFLDKPARMSPGLVAHHSSLVCSSETVADEDSYLCYSRNLKLALERGAEYENTPELMHKRSKLTEKSSKKKKSCSKSSSNLLEKNTDYAKVIDLTKVDMTCDTWNWDKTFDLKNSFVCDETRGVFNNYNNQMQKNIYKTMRHQAHNLDVLLDKKDEKEDGEVAVSKTSIKLTDLAGDDIEFEDTFYESVDDNEPEEEVENDL